MSSQTENVPQEETSETVSGEAANAAEATTSNEEVPLSRAQRRAAQFNKAGGTNAGRNAQSGGTIGPRGATGAPRGNSAPAKHSGRGK